MLISSHGSSRTNEHESIGYPALTMAWQDLLFAHWRWDPEDLAVFFQGISASALTAVPGLVSPFTCVGFGRVIYLAHLIPDFLELNLRTYVQHKDGRTGVWFLTLDCNHSLTVLGARLGFGLQYRRAKMQAAVINGRLYIIILCAMVTTVVLSIVNSGPWRPRLWTHSKTSLPSVSSFCSQTQSWCSSRQVSHAPYQLADAECQIDCGAS